MSKRWKWLAIGLGVGALVVIERLRPLRTRKEPEPAHVGRNLAIGLLAAATTAACELPIVALFHHSNVALPIGTERGLAAFVVTPRMHGIHHSTRALDTNANYSSLLSWWDRLHRTLRLNVPQRGIEIGVDGFLRSEDVTLERSLALPFERDPRLLPPPPADAAPPHTSA